MNIKISNRYLFTILVIGIFFFPAGRFATVDATELSFQQARDAMLTANESIKSARSEIERSRYESKAAQGLYFPKISLDGRATRIDEPVVLDLDPIRDAMLALHPGVPPALVPAFKQTVQDETFWKAQLNMVWPVFTGGRISAANRAAEAGTREADAKLRRTTDILTSDLVRRYFSVRLVDQVVRVKADTKQALDLHLLQTRRLLEEGLIAMTELLHAQVAQAQADRELKAARRDLELALTALSDLIVTNQMVTPSTPLFIVSDLAPLNVFIARALETHPALDQLTALKDKAHEGLRAEKASRAPQVHLFGTRALYESDLTVIEPTWAVGIGVNFTLFDGLSRPNRILAAQRQEDQIGLQRQQLVRNLETLVSSAYQEIMKAREQYDALGAALDLASENLRARKRAFEEGLSTSLDVVDAQLSLAAAETQRLYAAYNFDIALARLLESGGRANEFASYIYRSNMEVEK